ncbi:MAG: carbohydrate kinase [Roseivirga sp.]|nr:carbohydrate kinase [Roseivirga sp.]
MYLIGYDIGSSSIKAGLVEIESGKQVAVESSPDREMDMLSRQSGWAEQQPESWWQNLVTATRKLLAETEVHPSDIKAIGISYQMHGLVLVDKEQEILRPSIIWCDSRAVSIGDKAFEAIGPEHCLTHLLNSPGNFTASKLKWVKDNEPDIYERIDKVMLPGDYIAMKLTGEVCTTVSGLSEGVFWDYSKKEVSKEVLSHYGFDESIIPELRACTSSQGILTHEAADFTGLLPGTPVTYRAGDQPNNALSLNVLNPGEIAATCGTSGVVYGIVDEPVYDNQSRVNGFAHVNYEGKKDRIGILLCINGAGIQYSWLKHQVAHTDTDYPDMERMASTVPIGSDGVCILPFGNGAERIFGNKNIGSHILGLEFNRHNRKHLYRATLEGIAFSFVYGVNILKGMGLDVDIIRVGNDNMFQSEIFSRTIATLLNCQIEMVDTTGAYGAARAAGVAIGAYKDLSEALKNIKPSAIYEPDLNDSGYQRAYQHWAGCLDRVLQKSGVDGIRHAHQGEK